MLDKFYTYRKRYLSRTVYLLVILVLCLVNAAPGLKNTESSCKGFNILYTGDHDLRQQNILITLNGEDITSDCVINSKSIYFDGQGVEQGDKYKVVLEVSGKAHIFKTFSIGAQEEIIKVNILKQNLGVILLLKGMAIPGSKLGLHLNNKLVKTTVASKDGSFQFNLAPLDQGKNTILIECLELLGDDFYLQHVNEIRLVYDTKPPVIQRYSPLDRIRTTYRYSTITCKFTDNDGVGIDYSSIKLFVNGINVSKHVVIDGDTLTYTPVLPWSYGPQYWEIRISDKNGNSHVYGSHFTVVADVSVMSIHGSNMSTPTPVPIVQEISTSIKNITPTVTPTVSSRATSSMTLVGNTNTSEVSSSNSTDPSISEHHITIREKSSGLKKGVKVNSKEKPTNPVVVSSNPCESAVMWVTNTLSAVDDVLSIIVKDRDIKINKSPNFEIRSIKTNDREEIPQNGTQVRTLAPGYYMVNIQTTAFEQTRQNNGILTVWDRGDDMITVNYTDPCNQDEKPEPVTTNIVALLPVNIDSILCCCTKYIKPIAMDKNHPMSQLNITVGNNRETKGDFCEPCIGLPWNETLKDIVVTCYLPSSVKYNGEIHTIGSFQAHPGELSWNIKELFPSQHESLNIFLEKPGSPIDIIVITVEASNASTRLLAVPVQ